MPAAALRVPPSVEIDETIDMYAIGIVMRPVHERTVARAWHQFALHGDAVADDDRDPRCKRDVVDDLDLRAVVAPYVEGFVGGVRVTAVEKVGRG